MTKFGHMENKLRACPYCEKEFKPKTNKAKFCSQNCRVYSHLRNLRKEGDDKKSEKVVLHVQVERKKINKVRIENNLTNLNEAVKWLVDDYYNKEKINATDFFEKQKPLTSFESSVLEKTFSRSIKSERTIGKQNWTYNSLLEYRNEKNEAGDHWSEDEIAQFKEWVNGIELQTWQRRTLIG